MLLPQDLEHIKKDIFNGFSQLQSVSLPLNLQKIPNGFINKCSSLTESIMLSSFWKSGYESFKGYSSLQSIEVSKNGHSIGSTTCNSYASLENIVICLSNINMKTIFLNIVSQYPPQRSLCGCGMHFLCQQNNIMNSFPI